MAERAVGPHADAEFFADRQNLGLQIACPQRVLALQRRDRMHLVSAADGVRRRFGQAQMTHFAGLDQFGHRADGFFDGNSWIDAMLVIQIDMIDAEPLEAGIAGRMYVLGCSIDAGERAIGAAHMTELGGQHDVLAARPQDLSEQALVGAGAIHVGGVEKVDADVEGGIEHAEIGCRIGRPVEVRHAHATEADGGDFETLLTQFATRNYHTHGGSQR